MSRIKTIETSVAAKVFRAVVGDSRNIRASHLGILATKYSLALGLVFLHACGGGTRIDVESGEYAVIGSSFAPALVIPERYGGTRAFVQTATLPVLGSFVFHLDSFPPPLQFDFFDMTAILKGLPSGMAMPENRDLALVTTSGAEEGVFAFDPANAFSLLWKFTYTGITYPLPRDARDSAGSLVQQVRPVLTAGAAWMQGKVYLPTSNYTRFGSDPVCDPGTVVVVPFDPDEDASRMPRDPGDADILLTSGFNPTAVTPFTDRILLVTNTGVLAIRSGKGVPLTDGSVDVVDTTYDCVVAVYPLGRAAPSFSRIAIAEQQGPQPERQPVYRGFLGSAVYNHVYELDLTGLEDLLMDSDGECPEIQGERILRSKVLASLNDPIRATGQAQGTANFIYQVAVNHDATRAFATGFNSGTLAFLDLDASRVAFDEETGRYLPVQSRKTPLKVIQVTDPLPSLNETSPGPVAVRPGEPGKDFQGPDLFFLTGIPVGELRWLRTYE